MESAHGVQAAAPYEGARRFHLSALVQSSDLMPGGRPSPALPWSLGYTDELDQERFYLTNADLLRDLPHLLSKLRALPPGASIAQRMLNQGFPCYLFFQREEQALRLNVAAYREGRDRLLKEDIVLSWDEFAALLTLAMRQFLNEIHGQYPALSSAFGPLADAFNLWAAKQGVAAFQPPLVDPLDLPITGSGGRQRRSPLTTPIYFQEWRTHKAQNLRLNSALTATFIVLFLMGLQSVIPLGKAPLGYWLYPLVAVAIPWWLVSRYPAIPLNSPLWNERGVKFRAYFPDTVLLLSALLILFSAWQQKANIMWLWVFPLGWILCLFCGMGFPRTHLARPLWDWSRGTILGSLLVATAVMFLMADLGAVYRSTLDRDPSLDPPPVVVFSRTAQKAIAQWPAQLRPVAQPLAWVIDEYTNRGAIHQFFPHETPLRRGMGSLFQYLWVIGGATYALGICWSQLPSPTQVRITATSWQ